MDDRMRYLITLKYVETQRVILAISDCTIDLLPDLDLDENDIEDVVALLPKMFPEPDAVRIRLREYLKSIEIELTSSEFEKICSALIDFIVFLRYFDIME